MSDYMGLYNERVPDNIAEDDEYSLSMMMMLLLKANDPEKYANMVDLLYLLDKDNFIKILQAYGGTTIKVPRVEEFNEVIQGVIYYQKHHVEKKDPRSIRISLGFNTGYEDNPDEVAKLSRIVTIANNLDDLLNNPASDLNIKSLPKKSTMYGK